ncbi:MAG: ABC transporter permease [Anaerolineae bacterium]|nr:ABC transporter permease [Anaerolineae bacterium]
MGVIWRKVWSDLWHHKVRTLLAVLSIAAGVFAVGAIFGEADQLLSGMDAAHRAVLPSHINLTLQDRIDRDTAIRLKNIEGVVDIEVLNQVSTRYKLQPQDEWEAAVLIMRDDFEDQTYDLLQLKAGTWPEKDNIGVDRSASDFYHINLGDKIIFELDKTDRALTVSGKIRHPFVPPPSFGGEPRFFVDAQGLERFNIPEGEFNQLLVQVEPYSPEFARQIASEIKENLGKEDIRVGGAIYQNPDEHWGRLFVEGFNFVLQILAVISLIMSVILVTNTMTAIITEQINQIGIIKAVGGSTATILKIYLTTVLVYGLLAFAVSLLPGAWVAYTLTRTFLNLFNIDFDSFQISTVALTWQAVAALLIPLLAALRPVLSGAGITVRQAIASYGLGGDFGSNWLDRWVERVGRRFFSSPYAIALANMFRRKGRLLLTQLVLITAGTMFLMVVSLAASTDLTVTNDLNRRAYDVRINFEDRQRADRLVKMAQTVPGVEGAEVWLTQPVSILKEGQRLRDAGVSADLTGLPAGTPTYRPMIVAGRWIEPGDERVIVVSKDAADDNGFSVGQMVTLNLNGLGQNVEWEIIGIYQTAFNDNFGSVPIFAPLETVYDVTNKHNRGTRLLVQTDQHDESYLADISNQLQTMFEERNMELQLQGTGTTFEDRQFADSQYAININMLLMLAVIVALVGGIGLMGALSISVVERTREIGVMRAIGAGSRSIMGMFVMEGVLQGLFSWAVAVPLSYLIGYPVAQQLGQTMLDIDLDYSYNYGAVLIWLGVILVIAALAAIVPARSATRISVRESLAYA